MHYLIMKTVHGEEISIALEDPRFLPVYTYKQNWRKYKLYPMHEIHNDKILANASKHLENIQNHVSRWMPELRFNFEE